MWVSERGKGRFPVGMVTETSKECVLLPVCVGPGPITVSLALSTA